jgi:hypothetical protein
MTEGMLEIADIWGLSWCINRDRTMASERAVDAEQTQRYAFCGWHARENGCIVYAFSCRETPEGHGHSRGIEKGETSSFKIVCQPSPIWPGPDVPFQPCTVGWREARLLEDVRFNKARGFHSRAHMVECMKLLKSQSCPLAVVWHRS